MKGSATNVCKIVERGVYSDLEIYNFVLETNPEIMADERTLSQTVAFLVTEGSAEFKLDGTSFSAPCGTLIFGLQGERCSATASEGCRYIYISYGGERGNRLTERFGINRYNRAFDGFEGLIPVWTEGLLSAAEENVDIAAEAALLYAFSRLGRDTVRPDSAAQRALKLIDRSFTSPSFTLERASSELGYNAKYLSHIFKETVGVSFSEYLKSERIKHAVLLFDHGIDSVKNVAYLSGFSDPLYFSTVFKKEIGVSPKDYKKGSVN